MSAPYDPVPCSTHDRLEAFAVRGAAVRVIHGTDAPEPHEVRTRILDVFARDGAEYLLLANGERIRLDHIVTVEEVGVAPVAGELSRRGSGRSRRTA